jgi:septum site-determining protein MinD
MKKVWVVASGKGGTGKSTLTANLGAALATAGHKTLLIDLDVGLRCLDLCLGLDDRVLFDGMDVLEGNCRPLDAILAYPTLPSLFLLPTAQNRRPKDFDAQRLETVCARLAEEYDVILLDCPPGLEPIPARAAKSAFRGLIVATPEPAAIRDADRVAAEFAAAGVAESYLVLNRFRPEYESKGLAQPPTEIAVSLGCRCWERCRRTRR